MADEIEVRLARARTRLIMDKPFLGALVLRLPPVEADPRWCRTTGTDARKLYYNRHYIETLDPQELQFVLSHEALHCALSHFTRREHRDKLRWDVACDYAVNPLLLQDGLTPPSNTLHQVAFEGMTAEEIYPFIDENTSERPMDNHLYEGEQSVPQGSRSPTPGQKDGSDTNNGVDEAPGRGAPPPAPLGVAEQEALDIQWRQRLAGAAQQAMRAGKLGGAMARMIDHLLQPRLPWRALLARYMTAVARDDYSYMRPSRRSGPAILPSLRSSQLDMTVAIDTSGSLCDEEIRQFISEMDAIKAQIRARVAVLACDALIAPGAPWRFEPWEPLELPKNLQGGGGTRFEPVFDWVSAEDFYPDLLLYFTDGEGSFPDREPPYPVIWLVKGKAKVPWGQRIQLN